MFLRKIAFKRMIKKIESANDNEANEIMQALMQREKQTHPEYELVVMSLPRYDTEARISQLAQMMDILKRTA